MKSLRRKKYWLVGSILLVQGPHQGIEMDTSGHFTAKIGEKLMSNVWSGTLSLMTNGSKVSI